MNDDKKWEYGFRLDVLRALCCSRDCTEELQALLHQFNVDAEKSDIEATISPSDAIKDAKHEARVWGRIEVLDTLEKVITDLDEKYAILSKRSGMEGEGALYGRGVLTEVNRQVAAALKMRDDEKSRSKSL